MRTFIALEIPSDIVSYLKTVIDRMAKRTEGIRWVKNEGIHITVKFLGEIEEGLVDRMREELSSLGNQFGPIGARLGSLDAFPSRRSARVVVVKLEEGVEEMEALFSDVEDRLTRLDMEREKRGLVPHITLGRRKVPKPFPNGDPLPVEQRAFTIDNLVLFKSVLTSGGAIYTPLWKIKLGGGKQ